MIIFNRIEVRPVLLCNKTELLCCTDSVLSGWGFCCTLISFMFIQVVNRLRKEYVYDTLLNYGVHYDKTWIYDKIHHEINQFCSSHSLQQVYIDMFDQVSTKN